MFSVVTKKVDKQTFDNFFSLIEKMFFYRENRVCLIS